MGFVNVLVFTYSPYSVAHYSYSVTQLALFFISLKRLILPISTFHLIHQLNKTYSSNLLIHSPIYLIHLFTLFTYLPYSLIHCVNIHFLIHYLKNLSHYNIACLLGEGTS